MKAGVLAVAAALAGGAAAEPGKQHARRHAHDAFHSRGLHAVTAVSGTGSAPEPTCGCTTIYTTITGEGHLIFPPAPTTYAANTTSSIAVPPIPTTHPAPVVPVVYVTVCPTPGVYNIPATTITLNQTATVCRASSTEAPSATHTACPSGAIEKYPPGIYIRPEVVTTITMTNYVLYCPYTPVVPVMPTSTYAAPPVVETPPAPVEQTSTCAPPPVVETPPAPVKPTSTYAAPPVVQNPPAPVKPASTYAAPPVVQNPPAPVKPASTDAAPPVVENPPAPVKPTSTYVVPTVVPTKPTGQLGSSGKRWAIAYSPYQDSGLCKDAGTVAADIARIAKAGFSHVRVYSPDCSGLKNIGDACESHGLKIILGIFISSTGISGAAEQVTEIVAWGKWSLVDLVVVGNEAIFGGKCSGSELAAFILSCKGAFKGAGYNGPITTTETLDVWSKNAEVLCPVVDVVGCNIHPFFNADVDAEHAGEFVASQLKLVDGLCPGKGARNLETGWPSYATACNGKACAGKQEQITAIKGIEAAVGGKSVMFSMYNDFWKAPGAFGCEQSWGAIQIFEGQS